MVRSIQVRSYAHVELVSGGPIPDGRLTSERRGVPTVPGNNRSPPKSLGKHPFSGALRAQSKPPHHWFAASRVHAHLRALSYRSEPVADAVPQCHRPTSSRI